MRKKRKDVNTITTKKYFARYWQLYLMLLLPLLYFLVFKYAPMIGNVLAFRRYRPGMGAWGTEWVGLTYFRRFFGDPAFWRAFRNTLILSLINLVINFPIPIIFAILVNEIRHLAFKRVVQTVSYMPRFISTVVVIAILGELLSPSSGIINILRERLFGLEAIYYMNDSKYFRMIYVLVDTWQYTGWTAIIYLAAITGIPSDLYEAATIDGANKAQQIMFVTIPSIMPTIMVMLILNVGRLLSLGFEKVLLMYTPDNSMVSDIIDTLVYRTGLANQNYSYATAIGLFSGLIGIVLVAGSNSLSKRLTGDGIY
ncbi:MAG: ABC transporter permease subunit [Sphaerochaeta sp.]